MPLFPMPSMRLRMCILTLTPESAASVTSCTAKHATATIMPRQMTVSNWDPVLLISQV